MKKLILILSIFCLANFVHGQIMIMAPVHFNGYEFQGAYLDITVCGSTQYRLDSNGIVIKMDTLMTYSAAQYPNLQAYLDGKPSLQFIECIDRMTLLNGPLGYTPYRDFFLLKNPQIAPEKVIILQ